MQSDDVRFLGQKCIRVIAPQRSVRLCRLANCQCENRHETAVAELCKQFTKHDMRRVRGLRENLDASARFYAARSKAAATFLVEVHKTPRILPELKHSKASQSRRDRQNVCLSLRAT